MNDTPTPALNADTIHALTIEAELDVDPADSPYAPLSPEMAEVRERLGQQVADIVAAGYIVDIPFE